MYECANSGGNRTAAHVFKQVVFELQLHLLIGKCNTPGGEVWTKIEDLEIFVQKDI